MKNYSKEEAKELMNEWGGMKRPFLFIIDYEMNCNHIIPLEEVNPTEILFDFNGKGNISAIENPGSLPARKEWVVNPVGFETYLHKFEIVLNGLKKGNSFLTNLTERTPVSTNMDLRLICLHATAKYRLWVKDRFCALSPEIFIRINDGRISSYPMKGTIDATLPDAEQRIMKDPKEAAEHATIVDLIRNDLSIFASGVTVEKYRYTDRLETNKGPLLQVSSRIAGVLPENYPAILGDILYAMLPAGSICGAPKQKTCEIIARAEGISRGYYTGIAGVFDGQNVDSGVLIRFIEQDAGGNCYFRSGGGITAKSDAKSEYDELIQKVYVPVCRNDQDK